MSGTWRRIGGALAGAILLTMTSAAMAEPFVPIDADAQATAMQRGMNVLGYDPLWIDPAKARFKAEDFAKIHDAGFQTVRMVLFAFRRMDADGTIDPAWLATFDTMTKAALDAGLNVILDQHDMYTCGTLAVEDCRAKMIAFWSQIAPRCKDMPNRVIFELLNEPHGAITPEVWNSLSRDVLAVVRQSNPTRNVIIGPGNWDGIEDLPKLDLPDDPHIIVTVHYYHPMNFTHQGAHWVKETENLSGIKWGSAEDHALLDKELDTVKAWADAHHRPIFLGEFGAYDRGSADIESRMRYDSAVARAAEKRGFAWAYWQFDSDFVAFDVQRDEWVKPVLWSLVPPQESGVAAGR